MLRELSKGKPVDKLGDYRLVYSTPTTAFYNNGKELVAVVRGTRPNERGDVYAAASTIWNGVENTPLYKEEEAALRKVIAENPGLPVRGVGHSLGSAVIDTFKEKGLVQETHGYNAAIQPKDWNSGSQRDYNPGDILYNLYNLVGKPGQSTNKATNFFFDPIKEHSIHQVPLAGGATHREKVLAKYKLKDTGHSLEELAEVTSIPVATLQEVYNRGIGAYKTNPESVRMKGSYKKGPAPMSKKLSKEQWAYARVYSFIDGNDKHDNDLRMEGGIAPLLCRIGSKKRFGPMLAHLAPEHTTYVEPFAGSAAVFWYKEPAPHEYINDLDKDMISPLRLLKKAPADVSKYPDFKNLAEAQRYYDAPGSGVVNQLTKAMLRQCNGFSGIRVSDKTNKLYRPSNPMRKFKHIAEYKERIKNAVLSSQDYAALVKKHDGKDTFIFMDPPYEDSKDLEYAQGTNFDFERYAQVVKGLKSNWMITINDSPRIRELFKAYNIAPVVIEGVGNRHLGAKPRKELIITNYDLPRGWKDTAPPALRA